MFEGSVDTTCLTLLSSYDYCLKDTIAHLVLDVLRSCHSQMAILDLAELVRDWNADSAKPTRTAKRQRSNTLCWQDLAGLNMLNLFACGFEGAFAELPQHQSDPNFPSSNALLGLGLRASTFT